MRVGNVAAPAGLHRDQYVFRPGVAGFDSLTELGHAIENADQAMYAQRNELRGIAVVKQGGVREP